MEGLSPLHRRVASIDVHRMLHVVTVLIERPDGPMAKHSREFGGFKRDCRALAAWLVELQAQRVGMQSTGIYWKSVCSHLELHAQTRADLRHLASVELSLPMAELFEGLAGAG